jgi:hypothetical protein
MTRALDENDRADALRVLADPSPPLESGADRVTFHKANPS